SAAEVGLAHHSKCCDCAWDKQRYKTDTFPSFQCCHKFDQPLSVASHRMGILVSRTQMFPMWSF
ncbi:hypothetical protein LCGC14_2375010, partial [marine sediment metagenome]